MLFGLIGRELEMKWIMSKKFHIRSKDIMTTLIQMNFIHMIIIRLLLREQPQISCKILVNAFLISFYVFTV